MKIKTDIYHILSGRTKNLALRDKVLKAFFLALFFIAVSSEIYSQDFVYWRSSAPNGEWDWGTDCTSAGVDGSWHYNAPANGDRERPDCYANPNIIFFDNVAFPVMNLNSPDDYTVNQIQFTTVGVSRTINTNAGRSLWFKQNGLSNAKIENHVASTLHTFNVGIKVDAGTNMEFNPVFGNLVFNNTISNGSGNTINVYGTQLVTFNGDISSTSGAPGLAINNTATAVYTGITKTYPGTTTINTGATLQISSNQTLGDMVLNTGGTLIVDVGITLTLTGTWTGGGTIINNGTIILTGPAAFPGSGSTVTTMYNLSINRPLGVTLDKVMTVSNTLTLTDGVFTTTGNLLTIASTATSGITSGSATSFINGPVLCNLPPSLAVGSTYIFPIGKGGTYYPMAMVDPTTGTGTITVQAEAFAASTGGTAGAGSLSSISSTEYWSLISTVNLTNHKLSLTRQIALGTNNRIGRSTTLGGAYMSVGGTPSGNSITNSNNTGASATQYFVMAKDCVAPDVPTIAASANPICSGNSTTLSISGGNLNDASAWQWYTVSCGGTSAGSGLSIVVSPVATTTYYARGEGGGCVVPGTCGNITVTVNALPTLSTAATPAVATAACYSTGAQLTTLPYTASTNSPTSYTIDWDAAANLAGLPDQGSTAYAFLAGGGSLPGIIIPASLAVNTYNGIITISNANGCTNTKTVTLTVNALPVPTASSNTPVCTGNTINLSGLPNGMSSYSWTGPNGYSASLYSSTETQYFNTLVTTGSGAWADNSTIAGWYSQKTGTGSTILANDGVNNAGNLYSYGTGTNNERALGSIGSGGATAGNFAHGLLWQNNSGQTLTDIRVTYTLEQWRNSAAAAQALTVWYQVSASPITLLTPNNNAGWIQEAGLTSNSPITGGTAGALDGNLPANRDTKTNIPLTGVSLLNGEYIIIKWEDPDHSGNDHGLAIDDVSITYSTGSLQNPSIPNATTVMGGTYYLTVTDANGCTSLATPTTVVVNAAPAVTAPASVCVGSTANLTPSTGGTWISSDDTKATVTNAGVITGVAGGSVTFTFTETATGCSNTTNSVTVNSLPDITAGSNSPLCVGSNLSLMAFSLQGTTYSWSRLTGGFSSTLQNPTIINVIGSDATTYNVAVTNFQGCTSTASVNVSVNANPTSTPTSNSPVCTGNTIQLTGAPNGLISYNWSGPGGFSTPTSTATVTQDFNTLLTTGSGTWTDNSTIPNWFSQRTGSGTTYEANAGASTAGNLYSYGTGTNNERALGTIGSGNATAGHFAHGILYRNTSGQTITDIRVTYTLEQWRDGGAIGGSTAQSVTAWYQISALAISALTPGVYTGWKLEPGLTLASPTIGRVSGTALDGNAYKVTATNIPLQGAVLPNSQYIMIKWEDPNHPGNDHGFGIDDVTITFTYGSTQNPTIASAAAINAGDYTLNVIDGNGCKNSAITTVAVDPPSSGGTVSSIQTICYNTSPSNLTLTGNTGNVVRWERSADLAFTVPVTIAVTATTLPGATIGNLTATTYFRAVVQSGVCTAAYSTVVTITVNPTSVGGTASSSQAICYNTSPADLTLAGNTGSVLRWESASNMAFTTPVIIAVTATTLPGATIGNLTATTYFRAVVQSGVCPASYSSVVTISLDPVPTGGTATATASTVCYNTNTTITVTGYAGTIQWQQSANGITWANVTGGSGVTTATYTTPNLFNNTWYRAVVSSGACVAANSSSAQVTVSPLSIPGTATVASSPICMGTSTTLTVTGYTGSILWVYSNDGIVQVGGATPGTNYNPTYNTPSTLATTIYYRARLTSGACPALYTTWVPVVVNSPVSAITAVPATNPCPNVTGLKYSITAITGTTYSWTVPTGWNITSGQGTDIITVTSGGFGQNGNIAVAATNACGVTNSTLAVMVLSAPVASITADYCIEPNFIKLTAHPGPSGYTYLWTTGVTTQSISVNIAGVYTATVKDNTTQCATSVTPTVSNELVTNGDFTLGDFGFTTDYIYKADVVGNAELMTEGTYGIGKDPQNYHTDFWGRDHTTNTGNFMIVNGVPGPVVWKQENITVEAGKTYYFSAWGISLSGNLNTAKLSFRVNNVLVGSTVTLVPGPTTNNPPYNWQRFYGIWASGANTTANIEIVDIQTEVAGNDFGLDDISFGTLQPTVLSTTASANGGAPVCVGGSVNLSVAISGGLAPFTYAWSGPAGFTSTDQNPTIDNVAAINNGTYTVVISDFSGCNPATATATVSVLPMPTASVSGATSVCKGSAQPNILFTGTGTAPYTFKYNINGGADVTSASGNSISIPVSTAVAGDYTYTLTRVTSNNGCSQLQTSATTVTVKEVNATISGTSGACIGRPSPEINFTGSGWGSEAPYKFTYTINGQLPALSITNATDKCISIPHPNGVSGTFEYKMVSVSDKSGAGCTFPASDTATATIYPAPIITGTNSSCVNSTGIIYTTDDLKTGYTWSIVGGTITSATNTKTATVDWGAQGAQSIRVNYTNIHGCSPVSPTIFPVIVGNMWIGTTNNWNTPGNWCQGVPTALTDVVIPNGVTNQPWVISAEAVCRNLTLNGASASLLINPGQTLTVNGNLTNIGGTLTINSSGLDQNGSLIVEGSSSGTGSAIYERYLANNDRWFITSPPLNNSFSLIAPASIGTVNGTLNFSPYEEANNNGWTYPYTTLPGTLTPGQGYLIKLASGNTVRYSGTLNGDFSVNLPSTGTDNGWNAIGNPYTSAMRIKDVGSKIGFLTQNTGTLDPNYQAVYLWNQTNNYTYGVNQYYCAINNSGYIPVAIRLYNGPLDDSLIQVGQGFLVNIKPGGGPINFKKSSTGIGMQVHSPIATTMKSTETSTSWPGITLLATGDGRIASTVVAYNSNMTNGLDPSYDAGLLSASDFNIYTHLVDGSNNTDFMIQCLPDTWSDTLAIPIGIDMPQAGQITFKAAGVILPEGIYPVIEDRLLKINTALQTESDSLTVTLSEPSWGIGRFYLHTGGTLNTLDINNPGEQLQLSAYYNGQKIVITGTPEPGTRARIYDMSGRSLGNEYRFGSANRNEITANWLASGVYLLRIEGKNSRQTLKITVLNR